jgi:SPP1 family predicted phage head-tail adaptor
MAKCICAGDLRHRVTVQAVTTTRDQVGGTVETWTDVATLWAKVEPLSAGERYWRQQMNAYAAWKITVRFRDDLTAKHRVKFGTRTFEVRSVTNLDMLSRFSELACDELIAK